MSPYASNRGKMDCYGLTDPGNLRTTNHDQFVVADLKKSLHVHHASSLMLDKSGQLGTTHGQLLLVADGGGEETPGADASLIAVDVIVHYMLDTMPWFYRLDLDREDALVEELRGALGRTQQTLRALLPESRARDATSTTLTMGYLIWPRLFVLHAGAGRCYVLRDTSLEQVTVDHAGAQRRGGAKQAPRSNWSRVLWNVAGAASDRVVPDVYLARLQMGDALLLCTDGLTRHVANPDIAECLRSSRTAKQACDTLVANAKAAGGEDNVTVIVAYFHAAEPEPLRSTGEQEASGSEPLAGSRTTTEDLERSASRPIRNSVEP